jgi:predicted amidohydrolase YtcJ
MSNEEEKESATMSKAATYLLFVTSLLVPMTALIPRHAVSFAPEAPADLILVNGKLITMDAKDSIAQAVAISEGQILAVGTNEEIKKLADSRTRVLDLHGLTVTPGLIDAHCHFDETAELYEIPLSQVNSVSEVVELVRAKVAAAKPGEWVLGTGWDESKLTELRYIYATDLDKVSPNNPVWLQHTTGHYGVANSRALRVAKITARTKNPVAGIIDRDSKGEPTGVLKEEPAMTMVTELIPPHSHQQQKNGVLRMMADFNREGMTAAKDPGIEPGRWEIYQELLNDHKASVRIFALFLGGTTMDSARATLARLQQQPKPPQSLGDGMLLSGGVKIFMDGSGGGRTAWVYDPWFKKGTEVDGTNAGYPALDPAVYREMVRLFHNADVHVSTHAVGDRAIDWVVDSYAEVLKANPKKGLRHGIIHCNIPTDHAIATMLSMQKQFDSGYPETQPPFMWWIGDTYAGTFGAKREARLMPYKTYLTKGVMWAGGSDYPVTPYPARYGLWSAVTRKTLKGVYGEQPFGTAESVDIHTALRAYTTWAARQLFLEDRIGSIEVGKDADLAVWDRDLYSIPADGLKELKCELTLLRGKEAYRAQGTRITGASN